MDSADIAKYKNTLSAYNCLHQLYLNFWWIVVSLTSKHVPHVLIHISKSVENSLFHQVDTKLTKTQTRPDVTSNNKKNVRI